MNTIFTVLPKLTLLIFNNELIAIPAIIYALMMNQILLAYVGITKLQKS